MSRRLLPPVGAVVAVALGGCISVFPKQTPAQLYSFASPSAGEAASSPSAATQEARRVGLVFPPVTLPRAATGDQILTQTGPESAYISGVRWVAPAAVLFAEATERAFAASSTRTRLMARQEIAGAQGFLRLEVTDFEARYAAPDAPPTVRVGLTATVAHRTGVFAADRSFTAEVPAAENGARAIVDAYGRAVRQVTGELVTWTDANAALAAQEGPPVSGAVLPGRFGVYASPPATAPARLENRSTTSTTSTVTTTTPSPR